MGLKKIIHVNKHIIKSNVKNSENEPCITAKTYKDNKYCKKVDIMDDRGNVVASIVQKMDKPKSCGARVWIETKNSILIDGREYNE